MSISAAPKPSRIEQHHQCAHRGDFGLRKGGILRGTVETAAVMPMTPSRRGCYGSRASPLELLHCAGNLLRAVELSNAPFGTSPPPVPSERLDLQNKTASFPPDAVFPFPAISLLSRRRGNLLFLRERARLRPSSSRARATHHPARFGQAADKLPRFPDASRLQSQTTPKFLNHIKRGAAAQVPSLTIVHEAGTPSN